jgi:hypothetical protein
MLWFVIPIACVLIVYLWVSVVMVVLLTVAPERVHAADQRWPRVMRALDRAQMVLGALMLGAAVLSVTGLLVWLALHLPARP